jgi:hypothetical protein
LQRHEEWMQYIISMMQVNIFKYAIFQFYKNIA